jgi:hypothetical protein
MIRFLLQNYTLTLPVLGLLASGLSLLRAPRPWTSRMLIEALFSYYILFSVALGYFYNFAMHVFLGQMTAHSSPRWALQAWVFRLSSCCR